jgi:hypothetical protein
MKRIEVHVTIDIDPVKQVHHVKVEYDDDSWQRDFKSDPDAADFVRSWVMNVLADA